MSLPNLTVTAINFREFFLVPKVFKFSYLKKHHLLFALELVILASVGLLLAVSTQASVNTLLTSPKVLGSYPEHLDTEAEVAGTIRIAFSNPIDQSSLKPTINPPLEGSWDYDNGTVGVFEKE